MAPHTPIRIAVIAFDPTDGNLIEQAKAGGAEVVVISPVLGGARWVSDDLLVEAPEWPPQLRRSWEAAAVLRSAHSERPIDEAWFTRTRNAEGWIAAIERRRVPSSMPPRLIAMLTAPDEVLLRSLTLGDTAHTLAIRDAAAELLREADDVRGNPETVRRFKAADWALAAERPLLDPNVSETTKVSAIVAHKDLPQHLGECLASLRAQTVVPEIIVVDDGSGPEGVAALRRQQASYPSLRVIWQQSEGPSAARNAGARAATGSLLLFVDADNRMRPRQVETLREALRRWPERGFACSGMRAFNDATGRTVGVWFPHALAAATLLIDNTWGDVCALHRREVFERCGGFGGADETHAEDWALWVKYACHGIRGALVPEVLFDYRIRTNSRWGSRNALHRRWVPFFLAARYPELFLRHAGDLAFLHAAQIIEREKLAAEEGRREGEAAIREPEQEQKSNVVALHAQVLEIKTRVAELEAELEQARNVKAEQDAAMEAVRVQAERDLSERSAQIAELHEQIEHLKALVAEAAVRDAELGTKLMRSEQERAQLSERVEQVSVELSRTTESSWALKERLISERALAHERATAQRKELEQLQSEHSMLRHGSERITQERDWMRDELKRLEQALDCERQRARQLDTNLQEMSSASSVRVARYVQRGSPALHALAGRLLRALTRRNSA